MGAGSGVKVMTFGVGHGGEEFLPSKPLREGISRRYLHPLNCFNSMEEPGRAQVVLSTPTNSSNQLQVLQDSVVLSPWEGTHLPGLSG